MDLEGNRNSGMPGGYASLGLYAPVGLSHKFEAGTEVAIVTPVWKENTIASDADLSPEEIRQILDTSEPFIEV